MPFGQHRHETDEHQTGLLPEPSLPRLVFDRDAVRAVDRAAIEEYGVPGIVLMENAARGLLNVALDMLSHTQRHKPLALIICGAGNNGGDGYALARGLHNAGVDVALVAVGEPRAKSDAAVNQAICRRLQLPEVALEDLDRFACSAQPDLIVDAIFGTGLDRPPTGKAARAIRWINSSYAPVLAVDVPSGMDCDTGRPVADPDLTVRATRTATFVGHKTGFTNLAAQRLLGEVVVIDIGAPIELMEKLGRALRRPHPEPPEHPELGDPLDAGPGHGH